jgi:hypothetical protein
MAAGRSKITAHRAFPVKSPAIIPINATIVTPVHMCGAYLVGFTA